jgi:hypothetical protein
LDILKYKKTVEYVMDNQLKKTMSIKIKRLDMFPNHFFGITEINGEDYKINIQGQSVFRTNLMKLPIQFKDEKALLRLSGINGSYFEDIVNYKGKSEWIEIDSDRILTYLADHQDQIDTIDVLSRF